MPNRGELAARARRVLLHNTGAAYTRPDRAIYPHQWNWDSALCALGHLEIDPARAWLELETLVGAQHANGMIPHLIYHPHPGKAYLPGSEWWGDVRGRDGRATSGITAPPVLGTCLRLVHEQAPDPGRLQRLLPHVVAWHRFLLSDRDPDGADEPVLIHPWESGRDNAAEWDQPLARVEPTKTPFRRRDIRTVAGAQRPTDDQYARYLALAEEGRAVGWDQAALAREGSFRVRDPGFTAILARACADVAEVARQLQLERLAEESARQAERVTAALIQRAGGDAVLFALDCSDGSVLDVLGCASALVLLAPGLPEELGDAARALVGDGPLASEWGVRSLAPGEPGFQPHCYWRGPVWVNITFLVALDLHRNSGGRHGTAIRDRLLRCARQAGFREYVDADSGEGLGAHDFGWTAALVLHTIAAGQAAGG